MGSLSIGQVVLARFPFSDFSKLKLRPCLIIGLAEFDDVLLCQITSKNFGGKNSIKLTNNDFAKGSIAVNSFIRPDKIATADKRLISEILGELKKPKVQQVKSVLKKVLSI